MPACTGRSTGLHPAAHATDARTRGAMRIALARDMGMVFMAESLWETWEPLAMLRAAMTLRQCE